MFLWIDLRRLLAGVYSTEEALPELSLQKLSTEQVEKYLQREQIIFDQCAENNVLISGGSAFLTEEFGWFRLTFTPSREALLVGLERLRTVFEQLGRA